MEHGLRIAETITTDAKVIPTLVSRAMKDGRSFAEAFRRTVEKATGYKIPMDDIVGDFRKKNTPAATAPAATAAAPSAPATTAPAATAPAPSAPATTAPVTPAPSPSAPATTAPVVAAPGGITTTETATAPMDDKMRAALEQAKEMEKIKLERQAMSTPGKKRDNQITV